MINDWNALALLACGNVDTNKNETKEILMRLGKTISSFSNHIISLNVNIDDERLIIPFLSRSVLEAVTAALITRFDPFRVLIIQNVQLSGNYEATSQSNVALRWNGDVMVNEDSHSSGNIWSSKIKLEKFERALFSKHNYELFWKKAYSDFIDYYEEFLSNSDDAQASEWLTRLTNKSSEVFFESNKTQLYQLFSFFSKGIHYEFIIEPTEIYDAITVRAKVEMLFESLASILIVGNFINVMNAGLSRAECLELFFKVEEMVGNGV